MFSTILFLVLGFVLLIVGANFIIYGGSELGKKLKIPSLVIGMVVVGFGTSLPELIISSVAAVEGSSDISISNVVGSNIANIMLILGILLCITNINVEKSVLKIKIPFVIAASVILFIITNDLLLSVGNENKITRIDAFIFLIIFALFIFYSFFISKEYNENEESSQTASFSKIIPSIVVGIAGVYFGGDWVVNNAIDLAKGFGISEAFIGVSILAVGSSLPEIISSIVAFLKKNTGIAVGNIIGSNIFNTFLILGVAALINPLTVSIEQQNNIIFNILVSFLFLFVLMTIKKQPKYTLFFGIKLILFFISFMLFSYYAPLA